MKYEIGYITAWRRAIFFSLILAVVIFGLTSTIASAAVGAGLLANILGVAGLVVGIAIFILVLADKSERYKGEGMAEFKDNCFIYDDRKHHYNIELSSIKKLDIEPIKMGEAMKTPIAFRILIMTDKKKYYIESDRALGRNYNEVDLHRLYIDLQKNIQQSKGEQ